MGVTERERERLILRNWLTQLQRLGKSEICRIGWQARDPGEDVIPQSVGRIPSSS